MQQHGVLKLTLLMRHPRMTWEGYLSDAAHSCLRKPELVSNPKTLLQLIGCAITLTSNPNLQSLPAHPPPNPNLQTLSNRYLTRGAKALTDAAAALSFVRCRVGSRLPRLDRRCWGNRVDLGGVEGEVSPQRWTRGDLGLETSERQAGQPWMRRSGKQPRCEELQVASLGARQL